MVDAPNPNPGAEFVDASAGKTTRIVVDPSKAAPVTTPDPNRPEWLDPKFKSVEEQAKAYTEAQKLIGKQPPVAPVAPATVEATPGIDAAALAKEYANNGKLSDATMQNLAAKGITQQMVDGYITGLQAKATAQRTALAAVAGGEENLNKVYKWAATSMTPAEINAYNAVVDSGNNAAASLILSGIVQRYNAAVGVDPKLVKGERVSQNTASDLPPFESAEQVVAAMSDPKYANDSAYRQRVIARMAVTKIKLFDVRNNG